MARKRRTVSPCKLCLKKRPLLERRKICGKCENAARRKKRYLEKYGAVGKPRKPRTKYHRNYKLKRRRKDPMYRLVCNLRCRLYKFLKYKKIDKTDSFTNSVGCTPQQSKIHLEHQFVDGMAWSNYGEWHLDHILPLSQPGLSVEEIYKRNHFSNLQPLWALDNLKKNNKLTAL